jgi:NAD+ diphosphatase
MAGDAITFTGEALDRVAEHRGDPGWLAAQAADPAARAVLAGDGDVHVRDDREPRLALVPLAPLNAAEPVLLGLDETGPVFAVDADGATGTGTRPLGLRAAAAALPPADAGLAAHAAALLNWHRRHGHCANCGALTRVVAGGIIRVCDRCGAQHHPRTDPVVIMLVTDGDRVLLGRQPTWPAGRYSALAGFVEPGESLEEAVAREVREEAGIEVGAPVYVASQPWPFPTSLMLGFTAPWRSGEPRRIDAELEDVCWFERAQVQAAVRGEDSPLGLPPRFAIARRLLEHWLQR